MEMIIKTAAIGITGASIALLLKKSMPEIASLLSIATAIVILFIALDGFLGISKFIEELIDTAGLSSAVVSPVIKTVGIGLITKLSSDICRDSGQSTAGTVVDTAGTIAAITVALPLMKTVFSMISSLI
jgi:Stage III sporulation protein AC/AD protein family.